MDDAFLYVMDEPITHLDGEPFVTPQYFNLNADKSYYYEIMMSVLADGDVDEDCTGKWCIIKISKKVR